MTDDEHIHCLIVQKLSKFTLRMQSLKNTE